MQKYLRFQKIKPFEDIIGHGGTERPPTLFCLLKHVTLKTSEAAIYEGGKLQNTAQDMKIKHETLKSLPFPFSCHTTAAISSGKPNMFVSLFLTSILYL